MKTTKNEGFVLTQFSSADRKAFKLIIELLSPLVELQPLGRYSTMSADEVWLTLVEQASVMGSARPIERLASDCGKYRKFKEAVSLSAVTSQPNPTTYVSQTLKEFSATRFYRRAADKLVAILGSPNVFKGGRFLLLEGLSHKDDATQTRNDLIRRCPIFHLKSASDFMIGVGLSHDVIALDTRIIGIFRDHFGYNLTVNQIQSNPKYYFSLEAALGEICHEESIPLALIDRLLSNFSNLSIIELAVRRPGLIDRLR